MPFKKSISEKTGIFYHDCLFIANQVHIIHVSYKGYACMRREAKTIDKYKYGGIKDSENIGKMYIIMLVLFLLTEF
jgi:hypothetical protein